MSAIFCQQRRLEARRNRTAVGSCASIAAGLRGGGLAGDVVGWWPGAAACAFGRFPFGRTVVALAIDHGTRARDDGLEAGIGLGGGHRGRQEVQPAGPSADASGWPSRLSDRAASLEELLGRAVAGAAAGPAGAPGGPALAANAAAVARHAGVGCRSCQAQRLPLELDRRGGPGRAEAAEGAAGCGVRGVPERRGPWCGAAGVEPRSPGAPRRWASPPTTTSRWRPLSLVTLARAEFGDDVAGVAVAMGALELRHHRAADLGSAGAAAGVDEAAHRLFGRSRWGERTRALARRRGGPETHGHRAVRLREAAPDIAARRRPRHRVNAPSRR